jgi:hypothetical protein
MISYLIINIIVCVLAYLVGYKIRDLNDKIKELRTRLDSQTKEVQPTVTMGAYDKVDTANHVNTDSSVGIVEVKSPQLLEWEEMERNKREVENV